MRTDSPKFNRSPNSIARTEQQTATSDIYAHAAEDVLQHFLRFGLVCFLYLWNILCVSKSNNNKWSVLCVSKTNNNNKMVNFKPSSMLGPKQTHLYIDKISTGISRNFKLCYVDYERRLTISVATMPAPTEGSNFDDEVDNAESAPRLSTERTTGFVEHTLSLALR